MAKSFRLQFIDIDSSFTINTTEAAVKGYIVCRAPKGTTEAMYFNYGNEKAINAMIGLPTANWIDLYEAVAFNQEYGLYISAPPGTSEDYPSYYGGVYLTTRGPYDYWQVSDAAEPSFEVGIIPGEEPGKWGSDATSSEITIEKLSTDFGNTHTQGLLKISNISAAIFARTNFINLNYWGYDGCPVSEGNVTYYLDGTTTAGKLYYVDPDDGTNKTVFCGIYRLVGATYTIWIGGSTNEEIMGKQGVATSNNMISSNAPWMSFQKLIDYDQFKNDSGASESIEFTISKSVKITDAIAARYKDDTTTTVEQFLGINGVQVTSSTPSGITASTLMNTVKLDTVINYKYANNVSVGNGTFYPLIAGDVTLADASEVEDYFKSVVLSGLSSDTSFTLPNGKVTDIEAFIGIDAGSRFMYRTNIKSITFARVHQKSCNETPTYVEISNIGYDQWKYDQSCAFIDIANIKGKEVTGTTDDGEPKYTDVNNVTSNKLTKVILSDALQSAIIQGSSDGLLIVLDDSKPVNKKLGVFQLDATTGLLTDVTSNYKTQRFYIHAQIDSKYKLISNADDGYSYTVYEVYKTSSKGFGAHDLRKCSDDSNSAFPLKKDINFNTLTISCKEIVFPGTYTSGGEFTGSLSETGVDSFGSNIYWPNILPAEAVTFMEVVPVSTFDAMKAINDQGFFTGTKIVDPIGPAKDIYSNYIKGQRYCTKVNRDNQENGSLGSTWVDGYYQIIKDGLIEAQNPDYDDALVFMEPTGYEDYKSLLMSLRVKYHDTSTIISPKIITKAELMNPATITVSGRSKGTAQYIGEFKKYDTYTGKYYYCQPIGDVGLQLARIMDKKMGGIAPAGTNDSAGLGGCLSRSVLSAKWKFSDEALEILDQKGLCAITYDADNGLMIQSQKSTQDPSTVTDWSYLGHSMSFDLCKREIRDKVMVKQVFKRINQYWMDIRTKQVQAILDKRTTGVDPIWATATVDITGQNTPTTMAKRQFVMKVTCKVYVYSETVLLIFENLAQE